ncbi:hypothetical protein V2E29_37950 [Streptomyces diastatochromogenes]|uniref:hypothetical protein n=1 Tax=Streptomyces diastatochromogenes TaxID=42236 RepID=UPI002F2646A3
MDLNDRDVAGDFEVARAPQAAEPDPDEGQHAQRPGDELMRESVPNNCALR